MVEQNQELALAWDFVEHTDRSIFLTGKAGTGKTTFLRRLAAESAKSLIVVAPTGVAAINAGGVTIHSFFQLPLQPFVPGVESRERHAFPKDKLRIVRSLDLLVIDEISMVRADLLDAIDNAMRKYRRSRAPFGGVQLLMIGDLQQLQPVVTPADEAMLRPHYSSPYFFASHALQQIQYVTISLRRVFRQQDPVFLELLNHVRTGRLTPDDRARLNARLDPTFRPDAKSGFIRLTTHNRIADSYNADELMRLPGKARTYTARIKGDFPEGSFPTAYGLQLKVGAQVMFIKNDSAGRFFNGKIGHVTALGPDSVKVVCPDDADVTGEIEVTPMEWENARYSVNAKTNTIETTVEGTFSQLPLRPAWAVTIHKSQGLTFDHVIVDAGASFAPGQVYVALSRCRTLEGIVLSTPIHDHTLGSDPVVNGFISGQDAAATQSIAALPAIRSEYNRTLLLNLFNFRDISEITEQLRHLLAHDLGRIFPTVLAEWQALSTDLREQVISVADKWITLLANTPVEALTGETLQQRIQRGSRYFADKFTSIYDTPLSGVLRIRPGDKKVANRLMVILTDLNQALRARIALLEAIAANGFSIIKYLTYKQKATLCASRKGVGSPVKSTTVSPKAAPVKKTAPAKKKEPKERSAQVSLDMLRQGMTRAEIAEERKLALSTVTGHLQEFVREGALTMEELYTPALLNAMTSAADAEGPDGDFEAMLKRLDGTGLSPYDLRFYLRQRAAGDE